MKNILFAFEEGTPKYKQIYEKFKRFIEQGELAAHEELPSIRHLAHSLHVSRNTTLMAYDQLVAEGYIRGERRKGYFVNELEPRIVSAEQVAERAEKAVAGAPVRIDFRGDAIDQEHFPLKVWRRLANQVLTSPLTFQYGEPLGEMCLREQIATYLLHSRGVRADADSIMIGSSTQQMLVYLGHIVKEQFPSVIVEDPGYDGAREALQLNGFELETIPVYETGADFSQIDHLRSRLIYVTPSHHSPYGVSMSIRQRQMLIQWANHVEGYIIEDDYDSEFRYAQQPFLALASIDSARVIYLGNFSKSFLPGIRLSYMVLPQPLLDRYQKRYCYFESTTSLLSQLTMARFMELGEWNRHIKRMRLVYKRKMQCLVTALKQQFQERITIIGEQSGLYVLVKVHVTDSEESLIARAAVHGVNVYPTSLYFVKNRSTEPIVKIGFNSLTCDDIQLGARLLKEAWL